MELFLTLFGAIIFFPILIYLYRYSSGKHKVRNKSNEKKYKQWVNTSGKTVKKAILVLMVLLALFIIYEIISYFLKSI